MRAHLTRTVGLSVLGLAVAVALIGCGSKAEQPAGKPAAQKPAPHEGHQRDAHEEHEAAEPATAAKATDSYPLDVCVVSGQKLGSMGDPVVIQHEGRTVKFCCQSCVAIFKKDPAKYLVKLDAAKAGKPAGGDEGHDESL